MVQSQCKFTQYSYSAGTFFSQGVVNLGTSLFPKGPNSACLRNYTRTCTKRLTVCWIHAGDLAGTPSVAYDVTHNKRNMTGHTIIGSKNQSARQVFRTQRDIICNVG